MAVVAIDIGDNLCNLIHASNWFQRTFPWFRFARVAKCWKLLSGISILDKPFPLILFSMRP